MMHTNQRTPKKMVIRSRFRSTTDEEPSVEETPPPNRSESPPPLPLCRRTSRTITSDVMIRMTESAISTGFFSPLEPSATTLRNLTACGHLMVPADRSELTGVQAGAADEGAVNVLSRHNRRNVVGFDGSDVENTHPGSGLAARRARNMRSYRRAHLLRVVGRRDLAGADRPDRLPGDD